MKKIIVSAIGLFLFFKTNAQNVEFVNEYSYLKASWGQEFGNLEDTSTPDQGGLISVFLKNNDESITDKVVDVKIKVGEQEIVFDGWRSWPVEIGTTTSGNNVSFLNIKGISSEMGENTSVSIEVTLESGSILTKNIENKTPKVKLANIMPNQSMDKLYVYFRNDDNVAHSIEKINLNEWDFTIGSSSEVSVIGGSNIILPKNTLIVEITFSSPLSVNFPLSIRAQSVNISNNNEEWSTAGVRLVKSDFPLGSWHSSAFNPDNLPGRHNLRELGINTIHGPGNPNLMSTAYTQYFMRVIWEPNFGNPFNTSIAAQTVQTNAGQPYVNVWSVDDEPDLNGKPLDEQFAKSWTYWENDPYTSSYVNLAAQKKYQRYGWHTDVVSMDHYTSPAAPNILPLSWVPVIGRIGSLKEALEYSDYLKYNLEPRRTWTWSQLAGSLWNYPPLDFEVNYQFWAHIMGGAKGLEWFIAQANTKKNFPDQWSEAIKLTKQLNPIKNQLLYAEPVKIVETSTNKIDSRALVGKDVMIVIVANNDATYNYNIGTQRWIGTSNANSFSIEFTVPEWINIEQSYQAVSGGKIPIANLEDLGDRRYKISGNIHKEGFVYVFGINDTEAPDAPTGLNIPHLFNDEDFVLSWKEPFDNFGVDKYEIFADDSSIAFVHHPIFFARNVINYCDVSTWKVRAIDVTGNISEFNIYQPIIETTDIEPVIVEHPIPASIVVGQDTSFTVVAQGNFVMYNWYMSSDDGNSWTKIIDNGTFSGAKTFKLSIRNTPESLHNALFKCVVREFCTDLTDESTPAKLTITNVGIDEDFSKNIVLFPNPAGNNIYISGIETQTSDITIKILGLQGNVISVQNVQQLNAPIELNIQHLKEGIYFLEIATKENIFVKKFIKK